MIDTDNSSQVSINSHVKFAFEININELKWTRVYK